MTKVNRQIVTLIKKDQKRKFEKVEGDSGYLFGLVWEITKDAWAFHGEEDAERRLQRNVTNLIDKGVEFIVVGAYALGALYS